MSNSSAWHKKVVKPIARMVDTALDPSVVFSFDKTGFLRHRVQFNDEDLEVDMTGKNCVVTGGNSGLGLATAESLASKGAAVWLLGRNEQRSNEQAARLRRETGNVNIHSAPLDLTCFDSIDALVRRLPDQPIDVLVNNAGVLLEQPFRTRSGIDSTLATNLTGHIALTARLLPQLSQAPRSRIIWISSGGMYTQKLNVASLNDPPAPFDGVVAYAQTKRAMVVFSEQLAYCLDKHDIAVHCMHPGWAETPGVERSLPRFWQITKPILRTPEQGADTIVWLSVSNPSNHQTGLFWFDRKPRAVHLLPRTRHSEEESDTLWNKLHEWSQVDPKVWEMT